MAALTLAFAGAGAQAAPAFAFTKELAAGGGGCIGETRVFLQPSANAVLLGPQHNTADGHWVWKLPNGSRVKDKPFLETIGCGGDTIVISIDHQTFVLRQLEAADLGTPPYFVGDEGASEPTPRVRVERIKLRHGPVDPETECAEAFGTVRVEVWFKGLTRTVRGSSFQGCP
jgi:hypothetical protein